MVFKRRVVITRMSTKIIAFLLISTMLGCASGQPFDIAKDDLPTLKQNMGRIFVYRGFNPLALLKPLTFKLDGKNIADTYAATIFYHDVMPGKHVVNLNGGDKFSFNITMGGSIYLRYSIVSDSVAKGNSIVELIDPKIATGELENVRLIEKIIRYPDELE